MKRTAKRAALFNDLTGFGRCSLVVGIPVISVMGIQCCPVPTAVLSNHVGFDEFFFRDLTPDFSAYLQQWERLKLSFDGIYTGFLGSKDQIDFVVDFIRRTGSEKFVLVDPIMGEDGIIPAPYTDELCMEMRRLVELADVITPNLTEAAKLSDLPYCANPDDQMLCEMGKRMLALGCKAVVITGVQRGDQIGNVIFSQNQDAPQWVWTNVYGQPRVGTGDLFSSIVFGSVMNAKTLEDGVQTAARFLEKVLQYSQESQIPVIDGICYEPFLSELR